MKCLSAVFGWLGVVVVILAVFGRFFGQPTIHFGSIKSSASHVLVAANTLLLLSLFLKGCCGCKCKKDNTPDKAP